MSAETRITAPHTTTKNRRAPCSAAADPYALIRRLVWIYIVLWLIEGGLRRWFLPSLSNPLLLVRDPVVVAIYILAALKNVFPLNRFVYAAVALGLFSFVNALALGHGNAIVALYGMRCDYLHVPLIFIMGQVLRREDLLRLCKVAVWLVIPYTALLAAQFNAPQDAWVNRGLGGSLEGAGFTGVEDKFRPPGTFSFITGPTQLYPLFTACWFVLVLARKIPLWLMSASGAAILVAMPVSISRSLFLGVLIVALVGVVALVLSGRFAAGTAIKTLVAGVAVSALAMQLPVFHEGMEAFSARWEGATTEQGGFQGSIVGRVVDSLTGGFWQTGIFGLGTGYSTNVGQKLTTGEMGFGASEGEWGRLLYDNGLALGALMVLFRITLALTVLGRSYQAWKRRSPDGLIFTAAAFLLLLNGQWGQSTSLGAAIISGGLALAAAGGWEAKGRKRERERRTEDGGRRTEGGGQKSEVRGEGADAERAESINTGQRSGVRDQRSEIEAAPFSVTSQQESEEGREERGEQAETKNRKTEDGGRGEGVRGQRSEVGGQGEEETKAEMGKAESRIGESEDGGQRTEDRRREKLKPEMQEAPFSVTKPDRKAEDANGEPRL